MGGSVLPSSSCANRISPRTGRPCPAAPLPPSLPPVRDPRLGLGDGADPCAGPGPSAAGGSGGSAAGAAARAALLCAGGAGFFVGCRVTGSH